jgi:signal transduction histidine kinase
MSIKTRLLLVLCALLTVFLCALVVVRQATRAQITRIVADARHDSLGQLDRWLDIVDLPLRQFVFDYATWSETADALAQAEPEQIRRHLSNNLPAYGLDAVWLLQPDGTPIFAEQKNPQSAPPPPPALTELTAAWQRHETTFFAENSAGLWQYCISTVAATAGSAPDVVRGWLVAARRWDDSQMAHLERLTESKVAFADVNSSPPVADDPEKLVVIRPLNDARGYAVRVLHLEQRTPDLSAVVRWEDHVTMLFVAFGLLLIVALALCVRVWVLQPMDRIAGSLAKQNAVDIEPLLARNDEFTRIARLVETSFADRRALEREVVERKQTEAALYHSIELRARLARDLHDTVIQSIYAAGLGLESVRTQMSADPFGAEGRIGRCMESLNETIRQVRSYITDLEPDPLAQRQSFPEAVRALASTMQALSPVEVALHLDDSAARHLSPTGEMHALQIVRESISNAMRHGAATRLDITLRREPLEVVLEVRDNGRGFDAAHHASKAGHGLRNLQSRATEMGAVIKVESAEGRGAVVTLRLPLSTATTP